jgi:uncharacterized protein (DUF2141 family)
MKRFLTLATVLFVMLFISAQESKGSITVVVKGLKAGGTVYVSLFNQAEGYPTKAEKAYKKDMRKVSSGQEKFVFKDIPFGTYAASVWHDENDNGKMDTNLIGIPKEGTGASNDAKGKMGPPKFKDASFKVDKQAVTATINVNY